MAGKNDHKKLVIKENNSDRRMFISSNVITLKIQSQIVLISISFNFSINIKIAYNS